MSETKKLYRNQTDGIIGGVCLGLGDYLKIDPVLIRLIFAALALVNGLGIVAYFVLWLVVPDRSDSELSGEDVVRANVNDMSARARALGQSLGDAPQSTVVVGVILIVLGGIFLISDIVPWLDLAMLWPLGLIGIGAYLLITRQQAR